jgi:predicted porin
MKKNSIALAIVALSAPAFAADVTVYGILDSGYSDTSRTVTATTGASLKTGKAAIAWSQCVTSRLGVVASEDLGGGLKAIVKIETGLTSNPMGGVTQGDNTTFYNNGAPGGSLKTNGTVGNATSLGDRELHVTLDFGQGTALKIGFGSSPIRDFTFAYDSALQGNFVGSLITTDAVTSNNRNTAISLIQQMGPLKASIGVMRNSDKVDNGADAEWNGGTFTGQGNGYQAALQFVNKALSIGLAYQSAERTTGTFGNAANTNDLTTKVLVFGVSYDFGFLKLTGQYADIKLDDSIATNAVGEGKRSHENIGVSVPVGAGTLFAQISKGTQDQVAAATVASVSRDLSGFTVGGKYNFTKGTYAYFSYGQSELKVGAATDNAANKGVKANQYALGLVKVF